MKESLESKMLSMQMDAISSIKAYSGKISIDKKDKLSSEMAKSVFLCSMLTFTKLINGKEIECDILEILNPEYRSINTYNEDGSPKGLMIYLKTSND